MVAFNSISNYFFLLVTFRGAPLPPLPPLRPIKDNLPSEKVVVWDISDESDEDNEGDDVKEEETASQLCNSRAINDRTRKRIFSKVANSKYPSWASRNTKNHRLARDILEAPTSVYPLGYGCQNCRQRKRLCSLRTDRTKCAGCTAQGFAAASCAKGFRASGVMDDMRPSVVTSTLTMNQSDAEIIAMMDNVEAGANHKALIRAFAGAIIELRDVH